MAYDPQRERRRPAPPVDDPAPVDAILGAAAQPTTELPVTGGPVNDDPPPDPAVTPAPADPPSDRLLLNAGLLGAAIGIAALLVLRHLWLRNRRPADPDLA